MNLKGVKVTVYFLGLEGIQLRRNEKKLLSDTNTDKDGKLRFHILGEKGKRKKRIQTREEKIFVLANDCLTGDPSLHDLSMNQVSPTLVAVEYVFSLIQSTLCSADNEFVCHVTGHELYMLKWM